MGLQTQDRSDSPGHLRPEQAKRIHRRHVQGAFVRSGASLAMWLVAVVGFYAGILGRENLLGVSLTFAFIVLVNFPVLWVLRRIRRKSRYELFFICVNALDVAAFTGFIYSLGGIHEMALCLALAALITYLGVLTPPRVPFIVAGLSTLSLTAMVFLEHAGIIPRLYPHPVEQVSSGALLLRLSCAVALLLVVAFIASYTGSLVRKQQLKLRRQNLDLEQSRLLLGEAAVAMEGKNIELQEALKMARSSDRAKSEFLANMSHELRTPLNHIMGFTDLVLAGSCGELTELQEEYLNDVLLSSRHLLSLINDILDLSKVEAGKLDLEIRELSFRNLLESVLAMTGELAQKRGIEMTAELNAIPEVIFADERKMRQILYNLLPNSAKFTPEGGKIRVSASPVSRLEPDQTPSPHPPAEGEGELPPWFQIVVSDTGIGLRKEDLDRIFHPFEQVESSASRKFQGTGLGLSLTRRLVELHGGRIWAESEGEGKGSCFRVVMPLKPTNTKWR